jgi:hypothetical protein
MRHEHPAPRSLVARTSSRSATLSNTCPRARARLRVRAEQQATERPHRRIDCGPAIFKLPARQGRKCPRAGGGALAHSRMFYAPRSQQLFLFDGAPNLGPIHASTIHALCADVRKVRTPHRHMQRPA